MTPTSESSSPANEPPEFVSRPRDLSDDDEDNYAQQRSGQMPRKKSGYDSRIEQILYENPDLHIVITDAGKSHESGGSYIVYTIRTGVCCDASCRVLSQVSLTLPRTLRSEGGIPSSTPSARLLLTCIQL